MRGTHDAALDKRAGMKRLVLVLGVAALLIAAAWYLTAGSVGSAGAETETAGLRRAVVTRRDLGSTVLATGVIRPKIGAQVRVGSRVSGVLQRLDATVGERVQAGQLLAQLDQAPFQAAVEEAEAALAQARAEYAFAKGQHERGLQLQRADAISGNDFAAYERALAVAQANVQRAEATLRSARIELGFTRITAPISGVVASVTTQVGETVAASFAAPTFLTIIDLDRLEVWAYVDETDIGRVEVGQPARFTVDTYADTEFLGTVSAIRPQAEIQDAVVNYVTVIQIDPGHEKVLRPEMTTSTTILLDGRSGVLAVPNPAVRRDADGAYALLPGTDGKPLRRALTLGLRGTDYTEVVGGLAEGDTVLIGTPAPNGQGNNP